MYFFYLYKFSVLMFSTKPNGKLKKVGGQIDQRMDEWMDGLLDR